MIRRLRRAHLVATIGLIAFVPALVFTAVSARSAATVVDPTPLPVGDPASLAITLIDTTHTVNGVNVFAIVTTDQERQRLVLELVPERALRLPDLLVYWSTGTTVDTGHLLGSLRGAQRVAFALPSEAAEQDAQIIVYSLGHQEVVSAFPLVLRSSMGNR